MKDHSTRGGSPWAAAEGRCRCSGHDEVGEDDVEAGPIQLIDRFVPERASVTSIPLPKDRGKEGDDHRLVVDDQDPLSIPESCQRFLCAPPEMAAPPATRMTTRDATSELR